MGLKAVSSIADCENNNDVWEQLARSRQIGITQFQADTNALLMKAYRLRRQNFKGSIGRGIAKNTITQNTGEYYGVRMFCSNVKSGILQINSIGAMFTQTGTVDLSIYNNLGDLITSVTLTTLAGKLKQNAVDIELPLHSDYVENLEYFFYYTATSNKAMGNDLKCTCGAFKAIFDTHKPYFNFVQNDRNYLWSQWVMPGGYHSAGTPDLDACTATASNLMYGLTFDVELKCKINEVLCMDGLDFESNNLAGAMALAIQYKAASILAKWIINSGDLNRWTMINTEQLINDIKEWDQSYTNMVTFIADEADTTTNDCLICKDIIEMTRRGIMA